MLRDIRTGSEGSNPYGLTDFGGTLFFGANDGVSGYELWAVKVYTRSRIYLPLIVRNASAQ